MLYILQKYCLNWNQYLGVNWYVVLKLSAMSTVTLKSSVFMLCTLNIYTWAKAFVAQICKNILLLVSTSLTLPENVFFIVKLLL